MPPGERRSPGGAGRRHAQFKRRRLETDVEQPAGAYAGLTLATAAQMMREAVKDKSYRATPLGLEVAHFMRWFRNEYGATSETLRDYEAILAKLAIDHSPRAPLAARRCTALVTRPARSSTSPPATSMRRS